MSSTITDNNQDVCECGEKKGLKKVVCGYAPTKKVDGKLHYEEVAEWWCEECSKEEEDEEDEDEEEEELEDCDCGYTHHYEDKCPNEATAIHYNKWRNDEEEEEKDD
jgi:hypothetical protein